MAESKHTPGPWRYRLHENDDWGVVRAADGYVVAQCSVSRWSDDLAKHRQDKTDPAEANARLIAAAPDLLAALRMCVQRIRHPELSPDANVVLERADLALAKAEGR